MDAEVKKEFMGEVVKQINQDCSAKCFTRKNRETCMESCYKGYIKTFGDVTKVLRAAGYKRNSRYIELAYGNGTDEWTRIVMFNDLKPDNYGAPRYYYEENPFDSSKSR